MNAPGKTILFSITLLVLASGCTTSGFASRSAQLGDDTVDICYTQATHTLCERVSATEYANEVEAYREFHDMAELARYDD